MAPHILHIFPTFTTGGVQLRIVDVANRLGDAFTHTALSLDGRRDARDRIRPSTQFTVLDNRRQPAGVAALPALRRQIGKYAPDLVCTYNWGSMNWALAAATLPLPHIHFESGFSADEAAAPMLRRSLFRRLALRRVRALVVPSKTLHALARRHRWAPEGRLRWIGNGVDLSYYRRMEAPLQQGAEKPRIVSVAPLRREKRLDRLIEAAASLGVEAELRLCGDGPERPALEAMAGEAEGSLDVVFLGHRTDTRPVLEDSDVFAMTSATEQMPNALLQAMAMELPVVAFEAGDIGRILPEPQRALVFAQTNVQGFREGLATLLEDAALRRRLGRLNRARVGANHAIADMVAAYRALYEDAIGRKQ